MTMKEEIISSAIYNKASYDLADKYLVGTFFSLHYNGSHNDLAVVTILDS